MRRWLVPHVAHETAAGLGGIVEQVAPEDLDQARLGHERRQRQKHEMAFGAHPAPAMHRPLAHDVEIAVAAGKMRVVVIGLGELPCHRKFGKWAQQRVITQVRGNMLLHVLPKGLLERPALRPLVIDLAGARNLAAIAGRTLVGKHHLVHAGEQRR